MKRYRFQGVILTVIISVFLLLLFGAPVLRGADLKIMSASVSEWGTFAMDPGIRIFQGMEPDIALIQEWTILEGTHRAYVDEAFGPEFYYYLAWSNLNPVGNPNALPNGIVSRWEMQTWGGWEYPSDPDKAYSAWAIIDLPGKEENLCVVSVHLEPGDAIEEKEQRIEEANVIKDYVEGNFDTVYDYIIVGGDLNVYYQTEWCIDTFATFLEPTSHRPEDRLGDEDTNQIRTNPYDWIMPNLLLDDLHTTLYIGDVDPQYEYEDGIVFDSHVFYRLPGPTPAPEDELWNLTPVWYGDSHSALMDHMAVMKAFDVFPTATPTPPPTATPEPTPSPTSTKPSTPSPSPTAKIVIGPISGRVYDRETGDGIADIYVRAGGPAGGSNGLSDSQGYYTTNLLNAGTYLVYADNFTNLDYRKQYYNQKSVAGQAAQVPSNSSDIDFPLYRKGVYPSPTPGPSPEFFPASIDSGDYDGDGISDVAIFRPGNGLWAIQGVTHIYFGELNDLPASADFDGDGTTDIAVFRDSSGLWAIRDVTRVYFGRKADIPLPGDYDGDGTADTVILRRANGLWAIRNVTRFYFGGSSDLPAPFNGEEAEKKVGVFRPENGLWAIRGVTRLYFGSTGDQPVPANYQGNPSSAANFGVFRESSGLWAIRDVTRVYLGTANDRPVPGNYQGKLEADITIFRESNGLWAIRGFTRLYFGASGDLPVSGLVINPSGAGSP